MSTDGESKESAARQRIPDGPDAAAASPSDAPHEPTDGWRLLFKQFREFAEYASYYAMAKTDGLKLTARTAVIRAVLVTLAFIVVVAVVVMASWLLLAGMSEALSVLCGDRPWAGKLLTGALVLGGLGLATYVALARLAKSSRERTVEKYEELQDRQRERFEHDVSDRANATTAESE